MIQKVRRESFLKRTFHPLLVRRECPSSEMLFAFCSLDRYLRKLSIGVFLHDIPWIPFRNIVEYRMMNIVEYPDILTLPLAFEVIDVRANATLVVKRTLISSEVWLMLMLVGRSWFSCYKAKVEIVSYWRSQSRFLQQSNWAGCKLGFVEMSHGHFPFELDIYSCALNLGCRVYRRSISPILPEICWKDEESRKEMSERGFSFERWRCDDKSCLNCL